MNCDPKCRRAAELAGFLWEIVERAPPGHYVAVGDTGSTTPRVQVELALTFIGDQFEELASDRPYLVAIVVAARKLVDEAKVHGGFIGFTSRDKFGKTEPGPVVRSLMDALDGHFRRAPTNAVRRLAVAA